MSILWNVIASPLIASLIPFDLGALASMRWLFIGLGAFLLVRWARGRSETTLRQLGGEVAIVVVAYFAYFLGRGLVEGREAEAISRSIRIIEFEQAAKIFWEPGFQQRILGFDFLVDLVNWTYVWGHWPLIVFVSVWLFMLHREDYPVYRNAFIISGAIGLVIFTFFPVAPPRFLDAWGFVDTVAERSQASRVLQPPAFVNQYAAMPSLHFGWNLLVGVAIVRHSTGILPKLFGILMPVAMFLGIVLSANHYIVDGLAGGGLALFALLVALILRNLLQRRQVRIPMLA